MNYIEYTFSLFKKKEEPKPKSAMESLAEAAGEFARQKGMAERQVLATGKKDLLKEYYKNNSLAGKAENAARAIKSIRKSLSANKWEHHWNGLQNEQEWAKHREAMAKTKASEKILKRIMKEAKKQGQ